MTPLPFVRFCTDVLGLRLTPAQVVLAAVCFDDVDPVDLDDDDRAIARELFGNVDRIPAEARLVVALLKGARVGGTWLCSIYLLWRALTADLSGLAAGEDAFAVAIAPDGKTAAQALRYARGAARSVPAIDALVKGDRSDGFRIERPDGRSVRVEVLAASRGGASVRGRTFVAALLDEVSFFRDADSGVVNDSEMFRALAPRVIRGGKLLAISTAWMEAGLLWDLVQANHGKPRTALAVVAPTLTMRTDSAQLRAIVEEERERDPQNAAREFDCIPFAQGAGAFFDASAIAAAMREDLPLVLTGAPGQAAALGIDVAFRKDATGGCVVRRVGDEFEVCEIHEVAPTPGQHLVPSVVFAELVAFGKRHHVRTAVADQHYIEAVREHMAGLWLQEAPGGNAGKLETYLLARKLLNEGRVRVPAAQRRLASQLREVMSRPTPGGGVTISSPRRRGQHGDLVSSFVLALWAAEKLHVGRYRYEPVPARAGQTPGNPWGGSTYADDGELDRDRLRMHPDHSDDRPRGGWPSRGHFGGDGLI